MTEETQKPKTTMRAAYSAEFVPVGTPPPFIEDAPIPVSAPGMLLVRNLAASFNPVDAYIAAGYLAQRNPIFGKCRSAGSDFAGVVVDVGEGATVTLLDGSTRPALIGDLVFGDGIVGTGSFSEYVSVLAVQAVIKPPGLSFVEAAAIPLAALTSLQVLEEHAATPVGPGSKVLVLGGTGGVGSMAVQLAKALGASTVAATGSNTELLKSLGADIAINYHDENWGETLAGQDYDVIFATVADGDDSAERALGVLGPKGSFIYTLEKTALKDKENPDLGDRTFKYMLTDSTDAKSLVKIAQFVMDGKLKPLLHQDKTFPFTPEGWGALLKDAASGRAKGKLVMDLK